MKLPLFLLEDYFKQWEFNAPYLFSMSDTETWKLSQIMEMADEECRILWKEMGPGYTETQGLLNLERCWPRLRSCKGKQLLWSIQPALPFKIFKSPKQFYPPN